jgi:hypothetical protein
MEDGNLATSCDAPLASKLHSFEPFGYLLTSKFDTKSVNFLA